MVTETKSIKISKETYAKLCEVAGELQIRLKRSVSIEEAMQHLIKQRGKGKKITDLAGSWNITDKETKEVNKSIKEAWEKWKPQKS